MMLSSRTRLGTDQFRHMQKLRRATAKLLSQMPEELRNTPKPSCSPTRQTRRSTTSSR